MNSGFFSKIYQRGNFRKINGKRVRTSFLFFALLFTGAMLWADGSGQFDQPVYADQSSQEGHKTPAWVTDGIIYQINMRSFTDSGTIQEAISRLKPLTEFGITIVYLCPVFEADDDPRTEFWSPRQRKANTHNPKNPYRMSDYYHVDPEYGTDADLKAFIEEAHRLGMRVMLDMVYLHCGPSAKILAEHPDFARHNEEGKVVNAEWGFPALDFGNPELREYFLKNMEYWVKDFGADGFRLDVADGIELDFWREVRKRLDAIRPDIALLAEGTRREDQPGIMDLDYGFPLHSRIHTVMDKNGSAAGIREECQYIQGNWPKGYRFIQFTESHDSSNDDYENRQEKRWGNDACRALLTLCWTIDGVPMLYNGQEIADTGRHSIFGNFPIDWSARDSETGKKRRAYLKSLAALRQEYRSLRYGETRWLENSAEESIVSFERICPDETLLILINIKNTEAAGTLEAGGEWTPVFGEGRFQKNQENLSFTLAPHQALILKQ